ncbi:MAG: hypothetical protein ACYSOF_00085 [Planctomycetota bacterium]|jgi:molecular chaperone GrpE (heat shock protein)
MAKKTWIAWALFLLLPGLLGLSIQQAQKNAMLRRMDAAARQVADSPAEQEYLQMYEQWSDLPADQKADNPWGYGSYGGTAIRERLEQEQSDRILSDIPILEKGLSHYPDELADIMYGAGWRQTVARQKKDRAIMEAILIGSIFLLAGGGLILTGGLTRLLVAFSLHKRSEKIETSEEMEDKGAKKTSAVTVEEQGSTELEEGSLPKPNESEATEVKHEGGYFQSSIRSNPDSHSELVDPKATELPMKPVKPLLDASKKPQKDSYFGWAIEQDDPAEFDSLMTTEPLTKELTELTEEVSAIRQFAANQQDQMRKLQDGYDWMIIRRFCLRIIRCVDNIDDRIIRLYEKGEEAAVYLEDIRDELVFALEASGIEQFGPDLNVSFKGLEKHAEAVRERIFTEDDGLVGCIAEVTRPGYQYLVNDEDVKIVRCAQVKLYEAKQN